MEVVETDVLVVGAGPAGLTASALLARAGVKAIGITKYPGTADSPRAHITNQRTAEVLRDLGAEDRLRQTAMPHELMGTQIFATANKLQKARERSQCGSVSRRRFRASPAILGESVVET